MDDLLWFNDHSHDEDINDKKLGKKLTPDIQLEELRIK